MDFSNALVNEVGNRKRMKTDAEKLKQMITSETEKVIKIKVGQDTAYWELKEKCSTTERHHERLQQNMVQVQMQLETVSAQYQEELRRRPETLNKLASTREICDVLEENMSRLRASLQRSAADRATLAEAYTRASAVVAAAHDENEKKIARAVNETSAAQERATMSAEHNARLSECVEILRSGANKSALEAERLREHRDSLAENLARRDAHLQEKERVIQELREEMRRAAQEFAEKCERQRNAVAELEREAGAVTALRASLTAAEARAEAASRDVTRIASELAVVTAARDDALQRIATQKQELQSKIEEMNQGINFMVEKGKELENELNVKDQNLQTLQKAFADLQLEARAAIERVTTISSERESEKREFEEKFATTNAKFAEERESKQREYEERIANATAKLNEERERERCEFEKRLTECDRELSECKENFTAVTAKLTEELERQKHEYEEKVASIYAKIAEERDRERMEFEKRIEIAANERSAERERENLSYEERVATEAAKLAAERQREKHDFEIQLTAFKCDIEERDEIIGSLKHEIDELKTARANAIADLAELKTELERERKENKKRIVAAEREIAEKAKNINNLEQDIASEKKKLTSANNSISKQKEEHDKERSDYDERLATIEKQLADRNDDLAEMTKRAEEDRTRYETALNALKTVLNKTIADAGSAWEEVRTLKESVRSKDDEAKKQMKLILNARAEKEQLQKEMHAMQEKINSIQEITINKPIKVPDSLSHRDFPEHDDNAMPALLLTPTYQKEPSRMATPARRPDQKTTHARDPYSTLFSDTESIDDVLDVNRRFEALSRGVPLSPLKPRLKRRQDGSRNQPQATASQLEANVHSNAPQTQERPPEQKRKFFKTRREQRQKN